MSKRSVGISFITIPPASNSLIALCISFKSFVKIENCNPYGELFIRGSASSKSSTFTSETIGAKTSSHTIAISSLTFAITQG